MPRFAKISAEQERAELEARFNSARFLYVHSSFWVHERDETPGREPCECCGSTSARLVRVEDDLRIIVDTVTRRRWNSWDNHNDKDRRRFDALAAKAQEYGTPRADVWDVPIRFTCSEQGAAQIRDDKTRVIYWSGGWRSSKSHTASQWWLRGWLLHGGENELFWLTAPEAILAFRLMERIFWGRGASDGEGHQRSPSIVPKYRDPVTGSWRSVLASGLPAHGQVRNPAFRMVDGSIVELRHTNRVTALEGDTVRRILYDEAIRATGPEGYQILLGRVTQGSGQLGLASIPGEDKAWWLYDSVVGPVEAGQVTDKRVHTTPTSSNLWLPSHEAEALAESCKEDRELVERCIEGKWSRAGGTAYGNGRISVVEYEDDDGKKCQRVEKDPWQPAEMAPGDIRNTHLAKSWGFEYDVTSAICAQLFGAKYRDLEFIGSRDFNFRPQTGLVAKVYASNPRDKKTWHLVILDEHLTGGDAKSAAYAYTRDFRGKKYAKSGLVCDANGFWTGHSYEGKKSDTTDAYEFQRLGCPVVPPDRTPIKRNGGKVTGGEARNPSVAESKKLVRQLMREGRILVDGGVCNSLLAAIHKVRRGEKRVTDKGTAHDRQVQNFDDCLRYLAWAIFNDEIPLPVAEKRPVITGLVL